MIIYRIQDKEGRGPFRPGFSESWIEDRDDHDNLLPWNLEFGVLMVADWEIVACGCRSKKQLRRWFSRVEYYRLLSLGYASVTLTPSRILAESKIQCVFARVIPLHVGATRFNLYEAE